MKSTAINTDQKSIVKLLHYTFSILPIVAGADKFIGLLTDWTQYINPMMSDIIPFSDSVFMKIVGVIEIVAGILTLKKPEIGGYIVSIWLICIALTLLLGWRYPDIAVRDLVLAIAAFSMAQLAKKQTA